MVGYIIEYNENPGTLIFRTEVFKADTKPGKGDGKEFLCMPSTSSAILHTSNIHSLEKSIPFPFSLIFPSRKEIDWILDRRSSAVSVSGP